MKTPPPSSPDAGAILGPHPVDGSHKGASDARGPAENRRSGRVSTPNRIAQLENQPVLGLDRCRQFAGLINIARVAVGFRGPPRSPPHRMARPESPLHPSICARAAATRSSGLAPGSSSLANARADDADQPHGEDDVMTNSPAPSANCIGLVRARNAGEPEPIFGLPESIALGPNHLPRPGAIIHRVPVKKLEIELRPLHQSAVGANFAPNPVIGVGVTRISRISGEDNGSRFRPHPESQTAGGSVTIQRDTVPPSLSEKYPASRHGLGRTPSRAPLR